MYASSAPSEFMGEHFIREDPHA